MKIARFEFDPGLRGLLQRSHDAGRFEYHFNGPQSVKHLVEAVGVPHKEIGTIRVGSRTAGPGYLVLDGDLVAIEGHAPGSGIRAEPGFILDGHLGRLNAHLRMLGFDCLYQNEYDDRTLLEQALAGNRILLTRDRRLLMHKAITRGYLVRSLVPMDQLKETTDRYALQRWIQPFRRCIRCNHPLEPVEKAEILDRLQPLTKLYFEEFRICPACRQIYWKGSHFDRMEQMIRALQA